MKKTDHPLKKAREIRTLTLQQAAKLLDVSVSTYWNWEQPVKYPNAINLKKIDKLFGVKPNTMLDIKLVEKTSS